MGPQAKLLLDVAQIILDIIGIFEPTPFADGSNAVISVLRGQWLDALLSGAGVLPYLGDLAKLGKLPKFLRVILEAIELAAKDAKFAEQLRPLLEKLDQVLKKAPIDALPKWAQDDLRKIQEAVGNFLKKSGNEILDQLHNPSMRRYAPTPKHSGNPGGGVRGTPMDLNAADAEEVLRKALFDPSDLANPNKAPRLWGFKSGKKNGTIYQFHYDNMGGWHGFPVETKPPNHVLQEWYSKGIINSREFEYLRKLPNRGF